MIHAHNLKRWSTRQLNQARALVYTLESLPLPLLHQVITGENNHQPSKEQQSYILKQVQLLLEQDSRELSELNLPLRSLIPKNPLNHSLRWLEILGDSTHSFLRRKHNKTREFSSSIKDLESYPSYYQQNFHHQTDGYLTERSARLYEHQVELLFRGLANPMRRRLLKPLIAQFKNHKQPKILELACGTGSFTQILSQALPHAKITAIDISPAYIQFAKKRFLNKPNINCLAENAENLPFKDEQFDGVVSVFLHHELPQKVRESVIIESLRVCRTQGFWGLLDSIQLGDDPNLDWAIRDFPKRFHEPFFTNYIKNPIHPFLQKSFPERSFHKETHLLSQVLYSG